MNANTCLRRSRLNRVRSSWSIVSLLTALAFLLSVGTSAAEPIIKNLDVVRGELTFTEVSGALSYRVEWSATMAPGSWSSEAPGVPLIQPIGAGDRAVKIGMIRPPCFYRVVAVLESVVPPTPVGFALIPAGSFQRGDAFDEGEVDERPLRQVTVSAFYMAQRETTKALWNEVRAWGRSRGYTDLPVGGGKASNHPVQTVTWFDVIKWCNARSEKEGLVPCYYTNEARTTVYKKGQVDVTNDRVLWAANGHRLPTEAEWEKAARGGLAGNRFPWGDTIKHSLANYGSSSNYAYDTSPTRGWHPLYNSGDQPYTSPVGSFAPNGYGLYDMTGNVCEWCWDWYERSYYTSGATNDPRGPSSSPGSARVFRDGSWTNKAIACRVAYRVRFFPSDGFYDLGFRSARGR